jgi:hypothetical protein
MDSVIRLDSDSLTVVARPESVRTVATEPAPARARPTVTGRVAPEGRRPPSPQRAAPSTPPASAPDPAPVPAVGYVTVNADPYGTVSIDGVDIGDTPVVRHGLAPGRHLIRISREGCRPIEENVAITAGNTERLNKTLVCGNE